MIIDILLTSLEIGLIFSLCSLGVYLTFKILNFPDLTVDASLVTGAAVSALSIQAGLPIMFTLLISFIAGSLTGLVTSLIHIRFKINKILSGIIALTAFYTINLRIMGAPNISLLNEENILPIFKYGYEQYWKVFFLLALVIVIKLLIDWFLQTEIGLRIRAAGDNENTAKSLSVNINIAKITLVMISNGLVGFAGGLLAQDLGFADINMGIGTIILGIAGVMLGTIFTKSHKIPFVTTSVILGAVLYQLIVNIALRLGLAATDLKLVMALIVLSALAISNKQNYDK